MRGRHTLEGLLVDPIGGAKTGALTIEEDLIVEVDGTPVAGVDDLQRLMVGDAIGRSVPVRLSRDGRLLTVEVSPVELTV